MQTPSMLAVLASDWLRKCGHAVVGICTIHFQSGPEAPPVPAVKYIAPRDDLTVRYYVLAMRPKVRRPNQTCYVRDGESTFFIVTYTDGEHPEHSPFGPAFVMCRWTSPEPIDAHRPRNHKPHDRIPFIEGTI
jgi:hypothetical protein